jgi:hypothetical protein
LNPRPLGYEPYDARLRRLKQSLVIALTSADLRREVDPVLPRLPRLKLSRCVRFTNRFTKPVPGLRIPVVPAGATDPDRPLRPGITQVVTRCTCVSCYRRSLLFAVGRCCCCHRCCQLSQDRPVASRPGPQGHRPEERKRRGRATHYERVLVRCSRVQTPRQLSAWESDRSRPMKLLSSEFGDP